MCLTIKSGPHKAKKDFYTLKLAYKVTKKNSLSYYQDELQTYGKKLKSTITSARDFHGKSLENQIGAGLHSTLVGKKSSMLSGYTFDNNIINLKKGIILCKIPKNAIYYLGKDNDVVSNELILVEPLVVNNSCSFELEENVGLLSMSEDALKIASNIVKQLELNIIPS